MFIRNIELKGGSVWFEYYNQKPDYAFVLPSKFTRVADDLLILEKLVRRFLVCKAKNYPLHVRRGQKFPDYFLRFFSIST